MGLPLQQADADKLYDRGAKTGWDIAIDLGYYVTPRLTAGVNFRYTEFGIDSDLDGSQAHRLFNPNLYAKYAFEGESYFVPFVKCWVGMENAKFSTAVLNRSAIPGQQRIFRELSYHPAVAIGASLGLFYYTADYSGLFLEAGYHYAMTDDAVGTYLGADDYVFGENAGVFTLNAGVKMIIGSGD